MPLPDLRAGYDSLHLALEGKPSKYGTAIAKDAQTNEINDSLVAQELAFEARTADPFFLAHDCLNPAGHDFIGSCGEVVCCHCARLA
jgi:hypothetical protein